MANTYSQMYVQIVFSVKHRQKLIDPAWQNTLNEYIAGIIKGKGQHPIIVNGVPDHIHIFVGLKPNIAVSDLVRDIKNNSTNFINQQKFLKVKFSWQEGFAAFTYAQSSIDNVFNYIKNQAQHHQKRTFEDEYLTFLKEYKIDYNDKYLFD